MLLWSHQTLVTRTPLLHAWGPFVRRRSVSLLLAAALVLAAPPLGASAEPGEPADPAAPPAAGAAEQGTAEDDVKQAAVDDPSLRQARTALGTAERVLDGEAAADDPSPSLALTDLSLSKDSLRGDERAKAEALLARPTDPEADTTGSGTRPTDGNGDQFGDGYDRGSKRRCSRHFCLHWVASGNDAPPGDYWINRNITLLENVWRHHIGKLNYRRPLRDGGRGGNSKFDVYLKNVGAQGYYGYCAPERRPYPNRFLADGYCVLDNDFSRAEFGTPPMDTLRVTAAHEFFHAIQWNYDVSEDGWLKEATATWIEERFADGINDNRQFLGAGQVARPGQPLDFFSFGAGAQYGNWAFFEFLSQRFGRGIVRAIWNRTADFGNQPDQYSIKAVRTAVRARRRTFFPGIYARFAAANTIPGASYPEGRSWPRAPISKAYQLSRFRRGTGKDSTTLDHLTSRSFDVKRSGKAFRGNWKLLVKVNGPWRGTSPAAHAIMHMRNGKKVRRVLPLNRKGNTTRRLPFNGAVARVTLTLANASTRYRCWKGRQWSCRGVPRDDNRTYTFAAYTVRQR